MNAFTQAARAAKSAALAAILGEQPARPVAVDALQESRGDLHEATARRLGIPLAKRTAKPAPRIRQNRADRRAALRADEHARSLRLDTYSRRLTASPAGGDQ